MDGSGDGVENGDGDGHIVCPAKNNVMIGSRDRTWSDWVEIGKCIKEAYGHGQPIWPNKCEGKKD
jgi:hypothetical protein